MSDRAWGDERYVRLYTRDTPDWLCLSFPAQGLFCLLLRKVSRAGVLELGKAGRRGVFIAVGHAHQAAMLDPALDELLADGCVEIAGDKLVIPNFLEAQEAEASDKARARKRREKVRDMARAGGVTEIETTPEPVTPQSRDVTARHATPEVRDGPVTPRDAVVTTRDETVTPSRAVPPVPSEPSKAAAAQPLATRPIHFEMSCPTVAGLLKQAAFGVEIGNRATDWGAAENLVAQLGAGLALEHATEAAPRSRGYPDSVPLTFLSRVWLDALKRGGSPAKTRNPLAAQPPATDFSKGF